MVWVRRLGPGLLALLLCSCLEPPAPEPVPDPEPEPATHVVVEGVEHDFAGGRYQTLYYKFVEREVVNLYVDLSGNGGIIVEMSRALLGRSIDVGPGDEFWFFSYLGGGMRRFRSFENNDADFEGYSGWFRADVAEDTGICTLQFEFSLAGEIVAQGYIREAFTRM